MSFSLNPIVGLLALVSMIALSGCSRDNPLNLAQVPPADPVQMSCEDLLQLELDQYAHFASASFSEPFNRYDAVEGAFLYDNLIDSIRIAPSGNVRHEIPAEHEISLDLTNTVTANLTMKVGDESLEVGDASEPISLSEGRNEIIVKVTTEIKVPEENFSNVNCSLGEEEEEEVIEGIEGTDGTGELLVVYITATLAFENTFIFERLPLMRETLTDVGEAGQALGSIDEDDEFGRSVAVAGDVVAIGVIGDDSSARGIFAGDAVETLNNDAPNSGAVYIYRRLTSNDPSICLARTGIESNSCWALDGYLKGANTEAGDQFGSAVSLMKDSHGDYVLVVSAPGEDSLANGIFAWEDQLGATDEAGNDIGDGINDDAAGAAAETSNLAPDSGAVYVFKGNASSLDWQQIAYVKPRLNTPGIDGYNNAFGSKVLIRDGVLLVSAPKEDSKFGSEDDASKPNSGAVYVYQYEDNTEILQYRQTLKANVSGQGDGFGQAIALYQKRILVGAPGEGSDSNKVIPGRAESPDDLPDNDVRLNDDAVDSGAVYVFDQKGGVWEQTAYIKAPNSDAGDLFGSAVALGASGLWVGAPNEASNGNGFNRNMGDNSAAGSGAVYRFSLIDSIKSWVSDFYIKTPDSKPGAKFGSSLATENNELLVGAPFFQDTDNNSQGQVFGYQIDLANGAISLLDYSFVAEVGQENARFGRSLGISGTTFVIGSNGYANKDREPTIENSGIAYVYQ